MKQKSRVSYIRLKKVALWVTSKPSYRPPEFEETGRDRPVVFMMIENYHQNS